MNREQEARSMTGRLALGQGLVLFLEDRFRARFLDWAEWDDAVKFVRTGHKEFVRSNLPKETFSSLQVNAMAFLSLSGNVIWSSSFEHDRLYPLHASIREWLDTDDRRARELAPAVAVKGLLLVDGRPMLVAALPITPSRRGRVYGRFMAGEWLSPQLQRLTPFVGSVYQVFRPEELRGMVPQTVLHGLSTGELESWVRVMGPREIRAYRALADVTGKNSMVLSLANSREDFHVASEATARFLQTFSIGWMGMGLLLLFSADRVVASRIARLMKVIRPEEATAPAVDDLQDVMITVDELREALSRLEAERTLAAEQLRDSIARAEEAENSRNTFLTQVSQELRQPMNHILGNAEILEHDGSGRLSATQLSALQQIALHGRQMLRSINSALDLAHLEAGRLSLEYERFSIAEAVQEAVAPLQDAARRRSVAVACHIPRGGETMVADRTRLRQVLSELIGSAIRVTPDGGRVTVDAVVSDAAEPPPDSGMVNGLAQSAEGLPLSQHELPGGMVSIDVRDGGLGATHLGLRELLGGFGERESASATVWGRGAASSLALAARLVRLHGGSLSIHPAGAEGGGLYRLMLPTHPRNQSDSHPTSGALPADTTESAGLSSPPTQKSDEVPSPAGRAPVAVTLATGEEYEAHLAGMLLRAGYDVVQVGGGRLFETAREVHPHLLTLDVLHPVEDPWVLIERISKDPSIRDAPLLLVGLPDDRQYRFALTGVKFRSEPFDGQELMRLFNSTPASSGDYGPDRHGSGDVSEHSSSEVLVCLSGSDDLERIAGEETDIEIGRLPTGDAVLRSVRDRAPRGVVMDLLLPDCTALDLASQIRQHANGADVAICIVLPRELTQAVRGRVRHGVARAASRSRSDCLEHAIALQSVRSGAIPA